MIRADLVSVSMQRNAGFSDTIPHMYSMYMGGIVMTAHGRGSRPIRMAIVVFICLSILLGLVVGLVVYALRSHPRHDDEPLRAELPLMTVRARSSAERVDDVYSALWDLSDVYPTSSVSRNDDENVLGMVHSFSGEYLTGSEGQRVTVVVREFGNSGDADSELRRMKETYAGTKHRTDAGPLYAGDVRVGDFSAYADDSDSSSDSLESRGISDVVIWTNERLYVECRGDDAFLLFQTSVL